MSLKVTIEVNGQTEQQLTPVIGQVLARYSRGLDAQESNAEPTQMHRVYPDQSALLQQVQQLVTQNQMLQVQLSQSQRLLAGVPAAKAFLPTPKQTASSSDPSTVAVSHSADASEPRTTVPALPARYQTGRSTLIRSRLQRSPAQLWRSLVWLSFGQEWLLLLLLLGGGLYGAWAIGFNFAERFIVVPEFVESADDGPGDTAAPKNGASKADETSTDTAPSQSSPASPTSKAGSHPPPPPAFEAP